MKWLDNLKNIAISGQAGKCPVCGSENTDYICTVVKTESKDGYLDVWCNDCRSAYHVSRIQIADNMKITGEVPEDLHY